MFYYPQALPSVMTYGASFLPRLCCLVFSVRVRPRGGTLEAGAGAPEEASFQQSQSQCP